MSSYVDEAKQKSREKLREFIRTHVLSRKAAKDVRVVCFPGAEKVGEEAIEVKEVYDPLGIPRENVVGLECDEKAYKRLVKAKLGIDVQPLMDIDYFNGNPGRFDVVSLDYKGMQTEERLLTIHRLVQRRILADHAVLCTVYAAKREPKALQHTYALTTAFNRQGNNKEKMNAITRHLEQGNIEDAVATADVDMRDGITTRLVTNLHGGQYPTLDVNELQATERELRSAPNHIVDVLNRAVRTGIEKTSRRARELEKLIGKTTAIPHLARTIRNTYYWHTVLHEFLFVEVHDHPEIRKVYDEVALSVQRAISKGILTEPPSPFTSGQGYTLFAHELTSAIGILLMKPYRVTGIERYLYTSNKNMNMAMDLLAVASEPTMWNDTSVAFAISGGRIVTNPYGLDRSQFIRTAFRSIKDFADKSREYPEREYLGSSAFVKPRITKDEAITMLKGGATPAEILETHRGLTMGQLSAYRAHVTMQTYK